MIGCPVSSAPAPVIITPYNSNPAFDALSATALKEQDNTKRLADWDQAQKMVMDDAPIVTIFYPRTFQSGQKQRLKG